MNKDQQSKISSVFQQIKTVVNQNIVGLSDDFKIVVNNTRNCVAQELVETKFVIDEFL
jgi:hypothetical protein